MSQGRASSEESPWRWGGHAEERRERIKMSKISLERECKRKAEEEVDGPAKKSVVVEEGEVAFVNVVDNEEEGERSVTIAKRRCCNTIALGKPWTQRSCEPPG